MRYQLGDGTWVDEDENGFISLVPGPTSPALDTSIVGSFLRDTFGLVSAAIRRDFAIAPPKASTAAAAPAANAINALFTPQVKTLLTVAVIAFVAKKFLFP